MRLKNSDVIFRMVCKHCHAQFWFALGDRYSWDHAKAAYYSFKLDFHSHKMDCLNKKMESILNVNS